MLSGGAESPLGASLTGKLRAKKLTRLHGASFSSRVPSAPSADALFLLLREPMR
jgi:hypothetical protein